MQTLSLIPNFFYIHLMMMLPVMAELHDVSEIDNLITYICVCLYLPITIHTQLYIFKSYHLNVFNTRILNTTILKYNVILQSYTDTCHSTGGHAPCKCGHLRDCIGFVVYSCI